jgi:hypothetical protein
MPAGGVKDRITLPGAVGAQPLAFTLGSNRSRVVQATPAAAVVVGFAPAQVGGAGDGLPLAPRLGDGELQRQAAGVLQREGALADLVGGDHQLERLGVDLGPRGLQGEVDRRGLVQRHRHRLLRGGIVLGPASIRYEPTGTCTR